MQLFDGKKPLFIAHRGFTPVAPENSLVSFHEAAKRKYWAIETDVHTTADGVLVCCHDHSLKRTFGVDVIIEETPYAKLSKYVMNSGNNVGQYFDNMLRIPLFEEYIAICRQADAVAFIETKGRVVPQVIEMVESMGLKERSVLSSCSFEHIVEARSLSDIFVHHIFSDYEKMLELAKMGNAGLSYNYPNLDDVPDGLIEETHKRGVKVCLRAGDNPESVKRMLEIGLDYIPTNRTEPETY